MPKRSRQAHVPQQARKRRARRAPVVPADAYLAPPPPVQVGAFGERAPAGPAPGTPEGGFGRRSEGRALAVRQAGQLPTFERSFLVDELRRIAITAGSLFGLIVVLAVLLR